MRARFGLQDFARVATAHGEGIFRVRLSEGQQRGSLFVPIHWSGETASSARACDLVAPHTDPFSGPARGEGDAGRRSRRWRSPIAASR